MKPAFKILLLAAFVAAGAFAQSYTQALPTIQQASQRLDAATIAGTSAASGGTITITVPGNLYFYLTGIDITNCAGATAVSAAAVTTVTVTGLAGSPIWTVGSGTTAGACQPTISPVFSAPMKSATPGTNVVFTLPTFATNQTIRVNVYGYLSQ
jgi:hypothetical protein